MFARLGEGCRIGDGGDWILVKDGFCFVVGLGKATGLGFGYGLDF